MAIWCILKAVGAAGRLHPEMTSGPFLSVIRVWNNPQYKLTGGKVWATQYILLSPFWKRADILREKFNLVQFFGLVDEFPDRNMFIIEFLWNSHYSGNAVLQLQSNGYRKSSTLVLPSDDLRLRFDRKCTGQPRPACKLKPVMKAMGAISFSKILKQGWRCDS